MAISWNEYIRSLRRMAREVRPNDKPLHVSGLYRWAKHGLHGVRLETIQVGGTLCTSREALERFFARLAEARSGRTEPSHPEPVYEQRVTDASERVEQLLGPERPKAARRRDTPDLTKEDHPRTREVRP